MNSNDERYFLSLDSDVWAIREKAFAGLFNEGSRAVATLVAGAAHSRPRVRAACVALKPAAGDCRTNRSTGLAAALGVMESIVVASH